MTVSETLNAAADLIDAQPRLGKGPCRQERCVVDAIAYVSGYGYEYAGPLAVLVPVPDAAPLALLVSLQIANRGIGWASHELGIWNDAPGRTKRQVVAALRRAAREADKT